MLSLPIVIPVAPACGLESGDGCREDHRIILEQQTRFEAGMQALSASRQETDRRLRSTERLIRRLARLGAAQLEAHDQRLEAHEDRLEAMEQRQEEDRREFRAFLKRFDDFLLGRGGDGADSTCRSEKLVGAGLGNLARIVIMPGMKAGGGEFVIQWLQLGAWAPGDGRGMAAFDAERLEQSRNRLPDHTISRTRVRMPNKWAAQKKRNL